MPLNDIIAGIQPTPSASGGSAPEKDGRPNPNKQEETTLRTPRLMPPWIHNQTLNDRSMWELVGAVLGLLGLIKRFR
jgi:hypothetical protein